MGRELRRHRLIAGLTLVELGGKVGVSPSYLGRVENGKRFPSVETLCKIARQVNLDETGLLLRAAHSLAIETDTPNRTAQRIIKVLKDIHSHN